MARHQRRIRIPLLRRTGHWSAWTRNWLAFFIGLALCCWVGHVYAQVTWTGASNNLFTDIGNWSPGQIPTASQIADFPTSSQTTIAVIGASNSVAGLHFTAGASGYTFQIGYPQGAAATLSIGASGIQSASGATQSFLLAAPNDVLNFSGAGASINGLVTINANSTLAGVNFGAGTSAGLAAIIISDGASCTLTNASAGEALLRVTANSVVTLAGTSSAAGSNIINVGGNLFFNQQSSGGTASILNEGVVIFAGNASAATAHITNDTNLLFDNQSSAGTARIANLAGGNVDFLAQSSAARTIITNAGTLTFGQQASGGLAQVDNIASGLIAITGTASTGGLSVQNAASAQIDFRAATAVDVALGALNGAGQVMIGGHTLTLGLLNGNDSFAGSITGSAGTLVKAGTGNFIASGQLNFGGPLEISSGSMGIDGRLFGTADVASTAVVGGDGTITGNLQLASRAELLNGGSLGSLHVNGDAAFAPGAVMLASVGGSSSNAPLTIGGFVNLNGADLQLHELSASPVSGSTVTLISAAGGVDGRFAAISGAPAGWTPFVLYEPDAVVLEWLRTGSLGLGLPLSPNQQAVSGAISQDPAVAALVTGLDGSQLASALRMLSGESYASVRAASFAESNDFLRGVVSHQINFDAAVLGADALAIPAWLSIEQVGSHVGGDGNAGGYQLSTQGMIGGTSLPLPVPGLLSLAADASHGEMGFANAVASARLERADLALTWQSAPGRCSVLAVLAAGQTMAHTARSVALPGYAVDPSPQLNESDVDVHGELDCFWQSGATRVMPFLSWQWSGARNDAFAEQSSDPSTLSATGQSTTSIWTSVGAHLTWQPAADSHLAASLAIENLNGARANFLTARFDSPGTQDFTVSSPEISPTRLVASVNWEHRLADGLAVEAQLASQSSRRDRDSQAYLGVRIAW